MAVLDSRNNLANQEVFSIAKAADQERERAIGVMTKLDALRKGDEEAAIRIARNKQVTLRHGWYCVRNKSTQENLNHMTMQQRTRRKRGLSTLHHGRDWKETMSALIKVRKGLAKLMSAHIRDEFPEIEREIDSMHSKISRQLEALGPSRQTIQEQTRYLIDMSDRYRNEATYALDGRYLEKGLHPSKLRIHVQNAAEQFNRNMQENGATLKFKNADNDNAVLDLTRNTKLTTTSNIYHEIWTLWREFRGPELPGTIHSASLLHESTNKI